MDEAIGGYFELELTDRGSVFHDDLVAVNSGRNAFACALIVNDVRVIDVPYYLCDTVLQPLARLGVTHRFYRLDERLEPVLPADRNPDDFLLYVNYFGLKDGFVPKLAARYGNLIVDNSQAFFTPPGPDTDTFYSPRKFVGVPDGGFLHTTQSLDRMPDLERDSSREHMSHLLKRLELAPEDGHRDFVRNEADLDDRPLRAMSALTERLLRNVDFGEVRRRRRENFLQLHDALGATNELTPLIDPDTMASFMIYPYLTDMPGLRRRLIDHRVFVPTYWPDVRDRLPDDARFEARLVDDLVPLPVDQRYGPEHMNRILHEIGA